MDKVYKIRIKEDGNSYVEDISVSEMAKKEAENRMREGLKMIEEDLFGKEVDANAGECFSCVLSALKSGKKAYRKSWIDKGYRGDHIELQTPTITSKMTLPYIFISTSEGDLSPWIPSQLDIIAEDWVIF